MLTDPGDMVLDPFGGSCITGEVAERLGRAWICAELLEEYLEGAKGRFQKPSEPPKPGRAQKSEDDGCYRLPHPGLLWNGGDPDPLPDDGGRARPKKEAPETSPAEHDVAEESTGIVLITAAE